MGFATAIVRLPKEIYAEADKRLRISPEGRPAIEVRAHTGRRSNKIGIIALGCRNQLYPTKWAGKTERQLILSSRSYDITCRPQATVASHR